MSRNGAAETVEQIEEEARRRPRGRTLKPLRALLPFIAKYPLVLLAAFIALLAATAATLAMPIAVRFMIDNGFSNADPSSIDRYFLALFMVAVALGLASATRFFFVSWLGERRRDYPDDCCGPSGAPLGARQSGPDCRHQCPCG